MKQILLRNTIIQGTLLFVFWLLLSGHFDSTHISFGIISVFLTLVINYSLRERLYLLEKHEETLRLNIFRLLLYIPWLIGQIVIASLQVAMVVLHPRCPLCPALIRFHTALKNTSAQVILGNSITLTPGTITLDIKEGEFLVHALMDVSYSGIADDSLPLQVAKLYEKKPRQIVGKLKIIRGVEEDG